MSTKVPIYLKRGSRKGKKEKLRDILSSDMISPPLGDFRHTIHVGSGGESDTFGDISFLLRRNRPPRLHLDEAAASPASPSSPPSPCPRLAANGEAEPFLSHAGSLLSLHVDLGPSILEDVLQVMDRHQAEMRTEEDFGCCLRMRMGMEDFGCCLRMTMGMEDFGRFLDVDLRFQVG
uniref:Uncharacterized protein n=1 Tax=Geospiza parvula TaxID=87175 RepID=A0A8C3MSL1_GEOPR